MPSDPERRKDSEVNSSAKVDAKSPRSVEYWAIYLGVKDEEVRQAASSTDGSLRAVNASLKREGST